MSVDQLGVLTLVLFPGLWAATLLLLGVHPTCFQWSWKDDQYWWHVDLLWCTSIWTFDDWFTGPIYSDVGIWSIGLPCHSSLCTWSYVRYCKQLAETPVRRPLSLSDVWQICFYHTWSNLWTVVRVCINWNALWVCINWEFFFTTMSCYSMVLLGVHPLLGCYRICFQWWNTCVKTTRPPLGCLTTDLYLDTRTCFQWWNTYVKNTQPLGCLTTDLYLDTLI